MLGYVCATHLFLFVVVDCFIRSVIQGSIVTNPGLPVACLVYCALD